MKRLFVHLIGFILIICNSYTYSEEKQSNRNSIFIDINYLFNFRHISFRGASFGCLSYYRTISPTWFDIGTGIGGHYSEKYGNDEINYLFIPIEICFYPIGINYQLETFGGSLGSYRRKSDKVIDDDYPVKRGYDSSFQWGIGFRAKILEDKNFALRARIQMIQNSNSVTGNLLFGCGYFF